MLSGNGSSSSSKRRKLPAGPPPDFTLGNKLRSDYNLVQSRYMAAVQANTDLALQVQSQEEDAQRVQDEIDMILDQIYASDYLHLAPNKPTFFSDDDDDLSEDEEALENAETRAARQLKYGIQPSERPSKNGNANGNGKGKGKLVESNTSAPSNLNGDNHREGVNDEGNDLASSALRIRQAPPSPNGGHSGHKRARIS